VYAASGDLEDPRHATVEIHGAGGLYVKELVSGDDGRTEPSLAGLLGVGARVTDLDVLSVEGEDEPFEDEDFFLEPRST
jgi:tRNA pseudouridine synthase 10